MWRWASLPHLWQQRKLGWLWLQVARLSPVFYPTLMVFSKITMSEEYLHCNAFHTFSGVISTQEALWIHIHWGVVPTLFWLWCRVIFTLCCKLSQSTSLCVSFATRFQMSPTPSITGLWFFILHIFQFLHMPRWKIQHWGASQGFMILSGETLCSEPNEGIILIHMWYFAAVGDVLLSLVCFAASTQAYWSGCFVESLYKSLWFVAQEPSPKNK